MFIHTINLVVLLESQYISSLSEAPPADDEMITTDDTPPLSANAASALWISLSILSLVFWNEVDRHEKAGQNDRKMTPKFKKKKFWIQTSSF